MKLSSAAHVIAAVCVLSQITAEKLRGGARELQADGRPSLTVTEEGDYNASPENDCTVVAADHLMIPVEGLDGRRSLQGSEDDDDGIEFSCQFPDGQVAGMSGLDPIQKSDLKKAMTRGDLVSGVAKIDLRAAGASRQGSSVSFRPGFNVAANARGRGGQGKKGSGREATGRRKLAKLTGNKYTLVVKGKFLDYPFNATAFSAAQLSDDYFGTSGDPVNLKSQLFACSYGQYVTIPGPNPAWNNGAFTSLDGIEAAKGVLDIDMGVNMTGMTKDAIYNLFVTKTVQKLASTGLVITSLPGPFDHIIFARQTCLTECGWAAYAYINSWGQMFQGSYISQAGVQIHETGHNLDLGHSGSLGIKWTGGTVGNGGYTDHTCLMGNPLYSDDTGKMCFNPAKNYQINGWYNDAKLTLDPLNNVAHSAWVGDVVGVGEYNLRTNNEPVTIKIETGTPKDIFVGFNRDAGPNSQNKLADNLVNVIQVDGNDGVGYSQSQLIGLLDTSATYSELAVPGIVNYANLKIKVNSINKSAVPWKANLRIGFDQCASDEVCQVLVGQCFISRCQAQGTPGSNVLGCVKTAIPSCCGNDICERGESSTSCAVDCIKGPKEIWPNDCSSCWIRDGAMFDVEAKSNADLTIKSIQYKAYTATGNVRLYYRVGGKTGYLTGQNLISTGWIYVTQVTACGSWKYCTIGALSISVPRSTRVGLLVTYTTGGDVLYYNTNWGIVQDDYAMVHPGTGVNFNLATNTTSSFHEALMFSGKVTYTADVTLSCLSDADCADADLCNGVETCNISTGKCIPGTPVVCNDDIACTVDFCTPSTGACRNTPNHLICDDNIFCNGAETCDATAGCQAASNPCSGETPYCNEESDQCLECTTDAHCDDDEYCNGAEICNASGSCVAGAPPSCSGDTPFCSESLNRCAECLFHGDCDDRVACTDDLCSEGSCSSTQNNANCAAGEFCDMAAGCSV